MDTNRKGRGYGGKPFCSRKKSDKTLQIPRTRNVLFRSRKTGRRVSLDIFLKGSMTLEASLVLPFLLCAVTALLYIFAFTSVQAAESRELMERARILAVTSGQGYGSDPYVELYDAGRVSLPFSSMSFTNSLVTKKAVVRAWVGYTGESFQHQAGEELVYITPEGTVYHKSRDCTYLRLSVRQIAYANLKDERNQSGGRYSPCEYCIRGDLKGGTVYITSYGGSYHSSAGCQGLKRTVMAVPLSEAGGRPCCSRCGR